MLEAENAEEVSPCFSSLSIIKLIKHGTVHSILKIKQ